MSRQLINRSPDLKRLQNEGYTLEISAGYLLVREIPYVNSAKRVLKGILVCNLDLANDKTVKPSSHTIYFAGEYPCRENGTCIEQIRNSSHQKVLAEGLTVNHLFSAKPLQGAGYADYYEKLKTYITILSGPAKILDPSAKANVFHTVRPDTEEDSVFRYLDTASSRAEIDRITDKLKQIGKIAIVGLGGTGSYILDLVAKTPVQQIHLFDGDTFLQHNAFRSPGAASQDLLDTKPPKVAYLSKIYSQMHRGIIAHPTYLDEENLDQLSSMNFAFLCLDQGGIKRHIVEALEAMDIPFIDVGMGLFETDGALGGILRVTTSLPGGRNWARERIPFSEGNELNEYGRNIQIAELNALSACLAVIKWKKLLGFYQDNRAEHDSTYTIQQQLLTRESQRNEA